MVVRIYVGIFPFYTYLAPLEVIFVCSWALPLSSLNGAFTRCLYFHYSALEGFFLGRLWCNRLNNCLAKRLAKPRVINHCRRSSRHGFQESGNTKYQTKKSESDNLSIWCAKTLMIPNSHPKCAQRTSRISPLCCRGDEVLTRLYELYGAPPSKDRACPSHVCTAIASLILMTYWLAHWAPCWSGRILLSCIIR